MLILKEFGSEGAISIKFTKFGFFRISLPHTLLDDLKQSKYFGRHFSEFRLHITIAQLQAIWFSRNCLICLPAWFASLIFQSLRCGRLRSSRSNQGQGAGGELPQCLSDAPQHVGRGWGGVRTGPGADVGRGLAANSVWSGLIV